MRAALAKHPAPVMIGHPKELMADASPTPTPPPWGDHRCRVWQKDGMQGENESESFKDELPQEAKMWLKHMLPSGVQLHSRFGNV